MSITDLFRPRPRAMFVPPGEDPMSPLPARYSRRRGGGGCLAALMTPSTLFYLAMGGLVAFSAWWTFFRPKGADALTPSPTSTYIIEMTPTLGQSDSALPTSTPGQSDSTPTPSPTLGISAPREAVNQATRMAAALTVAAGGSDQRPVTPTPPMGTVLPTAKVITNIVAINVPVVQTQVIVVKSVATVIVKETVPVQVVITQLVPAATATEQPTNTPYPTYTPAPTQTPWIIDASTFQHVYLPLISVGALTAESNSGAATVTETPTLTP